MALSATDAARFSVVIDDAIQRLDLLRSLQKSVRSEPVGKRSASATTAMTALFTKQEEMQGQYGSLSERRQTATAGKADEMSRGDAADLEHELGETVENLRHCRRSIARAMGSEDPEHVRKLGEIGRECSTLVDQLRQLVFDLSEPEHRFASLSEKVWRCLNQDRQLQQMLERQSAAEAHRHALENDLKQIEERFAEHNDDIHAAIAQLTDDLKRATDTLAVQARLETDVSKAAINTVQRLRQDELGAIRSDIARCQADSDREVKVSARTKEFLELQIEANKTTLTFWEAKYADEFADKKAELSQVKLQHTETKELLEQLEARWTLEQKQEQDRQRQAAAARVQAEQNVAVQRLHDSAAVIQQAWRRAKQKREERAVSKKKKKGRENKSTKK